MNTPALIQKLWNYCNVLRALQNPCGFHQVFPTLRSGHDGMSYGDYVEQPTYLLFLKMADERTRQLLLRCSTSRHPWRSQAPYNQESPVPKKWSWPELIKRDGDELFDHYRHTLEVLGNQKGLLGLIFNKSQNKFDSAHPCASAFGRAAHVQIRFRRICQDPAKNLRNALERSKRLVAPRPI